MVGRLGAGTHGESDGEERDLSPFDARLICRNTGVFESQAAGAQKFAEDSGGNRGDRYLEVEARTAASDRVAGTQGKINKDDASNAISCLVAAFVSHS
jgi:hypothetical protein